MTATTALIVDGKPSGRPGQHSTLGASGGADFAATGTKLVVKPEVAQEDRDRSRAPVGGTSNDDGQGKSPGDPGEGPVVTPPGPPAAPKTTRFFGSVQLDPHRYGVDFKAVNDEILAHLASAAGSRLTPALSDRGISTEGSDEGRVRTVSENATVLKFDQSGFEQS